jgi:hypothetical protein
VLAALSTAHQIGLGLSGLVFVVFALTSAMVIPRRWPDFPGDKFGPFLALCFVLFVAMLAAVYIFGKESSPPEKHHEAAPLRL